MADSEDDQGPVKPSEQRGGTTPDAAEAREKGQWAGTAGDGVVPPGRFGVHERSRHPRLVRREAEHLECRVRERSDGFLNPYRAAGSNPKRE